MRSRTRSQGITVALRTIICASEATFAAMPTEANNPYFKYGFIRVKYGFYTLFIRVGKSRFFFYVTIYGLYTGDIWVTYGQYMGFIRANTGSIRVSLGCLVQNHSKNHFGDVKMPKTVLKTSRSHPNFLFGSTIAEVP